MTGAQPRPRVRHAVRRAFIGLIVCVSLLAAVASCGVLYLQYRLTHQIHRIDAVFTGLDHRPPAPTRGTAAESVNILVMGTDRRSEVPTTGRDALAPSWIPGEQRTDTIMLVHVDGDRGSASVVSIPRDSWVEVPGHGRAKINAAISYAGPALAVATVEKLTGIRIDHLAVVDWTGFEELTDQVGGVDVDVANTVRDTAHGVTWTAGRHHLDGDDALMYVRQRYGLPGGDLDRARRQQYFLRNLMRDALHQEMRTDPRLLYGFLDTLTRHLSVDDGWSVADMRALAFSLRNLRSADIHYLTAPVARLGWEGSQSVVRLDVDEGQRMWRAVRDDRATAWVQRHPVEEIADVVN